MLATDPARKAGNHPEGMGAAQEEQGLQTVSRVPFQGAPAYRWVTPHLIGEARHGRFAAGLGFLRISHMADGLRVYMS